MKHTKPIKTSNFINANEFIRKIVARNGIGVILGPKGSGKTFIKDKLVSQLTGNAHQYRVVDIKVISEEAKTITQIMSAMITQLSGENPKRDIEARRLQLQRVLGESASSYEIILTIDEAQDLHKSTLRGLKKIHETGFAAMDRLFTIILFAHPELVTRISDDELRPRFKKYKMQELTIEEKSKFIPDNAIFTKEALTLFLRQTRKNPLSIEESYDDLDQIRLDLGLKQIEKKHVEDYFSVDLREKIVSFDMSYRRLSADIEKTTNKRISASTLNLVVKGKYDGALDAVQNIINEYEERKNAVAQ